MVSTDTMGVLSPGKVTKHAYYFETGSPVAQAGLEVPILLPQPLQVWNNTAPSLCGAGDGVQGVIHATYTSTVTTELQAL